MKKNNLIDSIEIGKGSNTASAIGSTTTVATNFSTAEIRCCRYHRSGRATTGRLLCSQGQRNANTCMWLDSIWVHLPTCERLHQEWLGCSSDSVTYYSDRLLTVSKGYVGRWVIRCWWMWTRQRKRRIWTLNKQQMKSNKINNTHTHYAVYCYCSKNCQSIYPWEGRWTGRESGASVERPKPLKRWSTLEITSWLSWVDCNVRITDHNVARRIAHKNIADDDLNQIFRIRCGEYKQLFVRRDLLDKVADK